MHRAPIGSQRFSVAASTPSVEDATGAADAFGNFAGTGPLLPCVVPELHPAAKKAPHTKAAPSRRRTDIVPRRTDQTYVDQHRLVARLTGRTQAQRP